MGSMRAASSLVSLTIAGVFALVSAACGSTPVATGGGGAGGGATSSGESSGGAGLSSSATSTGDTASASGATTTTGGGTDALGPARQACIDKINSLRATKSLPPYARWGALEACVDNEVTTDESKGSAHWSLFNGMSCGESGQGECMGFPPTVDGISYCLDLMWGEKDYPECASCDGCPFGQDCNGCVFLSCGHYMAMSAPNFTQAACGFADNADPWAAIDYQ